LPAPGEDRPTLLARKEKNYQQAVLNTALSGTFVPVGALSSFDCGIAESRNRVIEFKAGREL